MIKSLKDADPLKLYLSKILPKIELATKANCLPISAEKDHVYTSFTPTGTLAFPLDSYPILLNNSPASTPLSDKEAKLKTTTSLIKEERGGVYLILHPKTNMIYIGSAINFIARFKQHKSNSTKPLRGGKNKFYSFVLENGGWSEFIWTPLLESPNYILEFIKLNPEYNLSLNHLYILRSFTQFELLFAEQSYIAHLGPELNSSNTIIYPFSNWDPAFLAELTGAVGVSILDSNERLISKFPSKYKAARALGISSTTLRRYSNTLSLVYSSFLEMYVQIVETNNPSTIKDVKFDSPKLLPTVSGIDLNKFESGKIFALLMDKVTLKGVYNSPSEAALVLDNKKDSKYISRYINLEHPVCVGSDKTKVYFVMNPSYKNNTSLRQTPKSPRNLKSIVLVDTLKDTAIQYSSVKELLMVLGIKSTGATAIVKRYMFPTRLYKNRYEFHYAKDFKAQLKN